MQAGLRGRLRFLVYGLAALLVGGQAATVLSSREYWPFSPYGMYADLTPPDSVRIIRLVGVTPGTHREVPLDSAWLRNALARASRRVHADQQLRRTVGLYLRKFGWRNPADRRAGHDRFVALRVYEQTWTLQPDAANRAKPDQSRLLLEYRPNDLTPGGDGAYVASR